jgi:selenocysteine lyase/cysteine desulfurase
VTAEDFAERISSRTRAIAISSVQWSNGFRCDLAAFSKLCSERNLWFVLDAIQQLGAVPIDVRETPVDFLACGGHKWLNSPFGCGFLYINREALPRLRPTIPGYLSVQDPAGGWGAYFQTPSITPVRDYAYVSSARRYETGGTANYPGAIGLAASVNLIHELGQDKVAAHIHGLTNKLISGLRALPVTLVTPFDEENRAGIVTFSVGRAEENIALMNQLLQSKILVSVRYTSNVGGIRVSCHLFNSEEDIDRLLNTLKSILKAR